MSWLSKALGFSNPSNAANQYLNQIPQVAHDTYQPYMDQGKGAYGTTKPIYDRLTTDPTGYIDEVMGKYKPSEGYQTRQKALAEALTHSAQAGGSAGTPDSMKLIGNMTNDLMGEDQQQYLQNIMGALGVGLGGENDFYNKGFDASGRFGDSTMNNLATQGTLGYNSTSGDNARKAQLFQAIAQALGTATGGIANWGTQPTGQLFGHKIWGE
jgi:hypothetical protein